MVRFGFSLITAARRQFEGQLDFLCADLSVVRVIVALSIAIKPWKLIEIITTTWAKVPTTKFYS